MRASTRFHKYGREFRGNRSLTVAAPVGAARVSKRCFDSSVFGRRLVSQRQPGLAVPLCNCMPRHEAAPLRPGLRVK
jgi:hypothetical protein